MRALGYEVHASLDRVWLGRGPNGNRVRVRVRVTKLIGGGGAGLIETRADGLAVRARGRS